MAEPDAIYRAPRTLWTIVGLLQKLRG